MSVAENVVHKLERIAHGRMFFHFVGVERVEIAIVGVVRARFHLAGERLQFFKHNAVRILGRARAVRIHVEEIFTEIYVFGKHDFLAFL